MAVSSCPAKRLDQLLLILEAVDADRESSDRMIQLAHKATKTVQEMKTELQRAHLIRDLAQLVDGNDWEQAAEMLQNNLPAVADRQGAVKEVVALTRDQESTIGWVDHLAPELRAVACEAIYQQIEPIGYFNKYQMLMLMERVTKFSIGVQDEVRAELEGCCRTIIDSVVEQIKENDYDTCTEDHFLEVPEFFVPIIVRKFNISDVKTFLLLIRFSEQMSSNYSEEVGACIIYTLLVALEENFLLDSEQALHLWTHVEAVMLSAQKIEWYFDDDFSDSSDFADFLETFALPRDVLNKLNLMKPRLLLRYQRYVEHENKQKIRDLHNKNDDFVHIVPEFVTWYFNGDSKRTQNLYAVARIEFENCEVSKAILLQVHDAMIKMQQIHTFEAFYLFNELKKRGLLLSKLPNCVRFLLNCNKEHDLQVVNKFFQGRLCVQQENPCCFVSAQLDKEKQVCCAKVDRKTALTRISFQSEEKPWRELHARPDGVSGLVAKGNGTRWMIKHVDDQHVKIFTHDGTFLTAGAPCENDNLKIVVFLMKEDDSNKQLWRITEPAVISRPLKTEVLPRKTRKRTM